MKTKRWSHTDKNSLEEEINALIREGYIIITVVPLSYDRPVLFSDLVKALIVYDDKPYVPGRGICGPG